MITDVLMNFLKSVLNSWYLARLSISAVEISEACAAGATLRFVVIVER
ncbi:MAG TPA: hypothetical protein VGU72_01590 [Beijerinckiaceae bacterium]|jgi:hypothetical protein|nr:hypothetical protein [Beijerinckiaceae bacterium]